MKNELKLFYDMITLHSKKINLANSMQWIDIIKTNNGNKTIGINSEGEWIIIILDQIYLLNAEKSFLYSMSFLEKPFEQIIKEIRANLNDMFYKIDIKKIFPFVEIIKFVFREACDDYWFELALEWYQNMDLINKIELIDDLEKISQNKKYSQKNRQKAKSIISKQKNNM